MGIVSKPLVAAPLAAILGISLAALAVVGFGAWSWLTAREAVPEESAYAIDLEERAGLQTEEGKAILDLLDSQINPQVAAHGGHISLIDVKENTAFVRLEGGCQGCSASSATLRQGVEVEIKRLELSDT